MNNTPPAASERREHHNVREIFAQACALLAPVVAANDTVMTVSRFAMTHMLQDHFPELSPTEINVAIATVEKVHREERIQAILNKKS
jgi:uncharacterized tellurite resistance protein B-like protein